MLRLIALVLLAATAHAEPPKPKFKLGNDTTFVAEPLDADGYLDYETALNDRLRGKITPETNAVVLLWQAAGPKSAGKEMHADFYKWLGVKAPPAAGDYFQEMNVFLKARGLDPADPDVEKAGGGLRKRPWTAKDHPDFAAWLAVNEKPLAVVVRASACKDYYNPLVSRTSAGDRGLLIGALLPGVSKVREFGHALAGRAMLAAGEGKFDAAWADLLAVHRLARLTDRGGTLIELLTGIALDSVAGQADLAFLDRAKPDAKRTAQYLADLRALPPLPAVADRIDLAERLTALDAAQDMRKEGQPALEKLDWDAILRAMNAGYDRTAQALRRPDRPTRQREWSAIEKEGADQNKELGDPSDLIARVRAGADPGPAVGRKIGIALRYQLMPAGGRVSGKADQAEQRQRNLHLAFALAAHQADYGKYPAALADLAPKYLANVPDDLFSEKPPVYKPTAGGYLLYSVGENGKDDGGASADDDPKGDDLPVRMK